MKKLLVPGLRNPGKTWITNRYMYNTKVEWSLYTFTIVCHYYSVWCHPKMKKILVHFGSAKEKETKKNF